VVGSGRFFLEESFCRFAPEQTIDGCPRKVSGEMSNFLVGEREFGNKLRSAGFQREQAKLHLQPFPFSD
jgi:hypothetical protein